MKSAIFQRLQQEYKPQIMQLHRNQEKDELAILRDTLIGKTELEAEKRKEEAIFNPEQKKVYTTIGGVPFLDNNYTVYGEVIDGMDIVDQIENVETNSSDRPLTNIVINSVEIL